MRDARTLPCVLALSGLDPGGGAGLLADARAIHAAGAFACTVATLLTVQSTSGLQRTLPVASRLWVAQARAVLADQNVLAIKVGALGTAQNVRAMGALLAARREIPAVIDPVMLPTRTQGGARLLAENALTTLRKELAPRATIITANAPEAEALTKRRVTNLIEARIAARAIVDMGAHAALVKGGHLAGARAVDVLAVGDELIELGAVRLKLRRKVHGGGCVLSSIVAARLALGDDVVRAVRFAKRAHHAALARAVDVGGDLSVIVP